ncbi:TRAP-type mannitol/chloroaromatic compound transport system permease large subunit [Labrenzia sp. EL_208]|nr:TRAP transporter large permease subunit [Roseibium album]MBG6156942.1 TRAP-type mannitol/chloroaromatic compound transport system permease large subunit [Labrenzia sp. EL_162]MBG6172979.1 TRAP-type mannitol/chloroaromatic compound transport system permease large subunit [Labrenzia sp. EL_132]MBG6195117.1 TRAP-type mannitol/chloroaromatic compound transport system permease large subunit [Labrenzia sp. EL_159]MBG6228251.1 TRAP-type mannitol/chloroaromatic compound transport system permease lar
MDVGTISIVLVFGLLFLLGIGMPLGFASAILAALVMIMKFEPTLLTDPASFGTGLLTSNPGTGPLYLLTQKIFDLMTEYVLISVPLFIFMAALLERSGIAKQMYDSLDFWLSRARGGVAIVTSIMAVLMAAMSGIIGGEVVLLGLIALPQMLRLGYNQNLAIGTICASGSLGTMIPPSIVLIIYGLITETSIKALFTGAFIPGFMLASFIMIYIIVRTQLDPSQAPLPEPREGDPEGGEKLLMFGGFVSVVATGIMAVLIAWTAFLTVMGRNDPSVEGFEAPLVGMTSDLPWLIGIAVIALAFIFLVAGRQRTASGWEHGKGLVPPLLVIGIVLGSIYGGVTGITEAAGMGAVAVFLIAVFRGEASVDLLWVSMMRTLRSTGTIIWVTIGAATLAGAYTLAGGPTYIAQLIIGADMPSMLVILTMMVILLFMGAFMDWVGIVLLIIPVFLPIVKRLPIDEIGFIGTLSPQHVAVWFGVLFCMNMQVSFLSPPFGPAAFYLKSVAPAHISLTDIFRGFLPFIGVQLVALAVLLIWPTIVTLLL